MKGLDWAQPKYGSWHSFLVTCGQRKLLLQYIISQASLTSNICKSLDKDHSDSSRTWEMDMQFLSFLKAYKFQTSGDLRSQSSTVTQWPPLVLGLQSPSVYSYLSQWLIWCFIYHQTARPLSTVDAYILFISVSLGISLMLGTCLKHDKYLVNKCYYFI